MKTCPACRKRVDVRATKCPYCHTSFDADAMSAGRDEFRRTRRLKLLAFVAIVVWGIYWVTQPENSAWIATL